MQLDPRSLKIRLMAGSLFVAMVTFSDAAFAEDANRLFKYDDAALLGIVAAETTASAEKCNRLCETRSGCIGYDHLEVNGLCRLFASVTGAQDEIGRFAAVRQPISRYRPTLNAPAPVDAKSLWDHNGSVMTLRATSSHDGSTDVEIVYETPKIELVDVGIRPGSILFKGSVSDGNLTGKARLSSRRCGIIEYDVEGLFDPSSRVPFYLRGAAPKRGSDCVVQQWVRIGGNATLRFDPS